MQHPLPLNQENLSQISSKVGCPTYDRSRLATGIVHVGVGGFHRSHEAVYTDQLLQSGDDLRWGICGVGLRESDRKMQAILQEQDYLYTLIVKHPDGTIEAKVIGSLVDFLIGPDNPKAVIERMAAPETHIVSLTITEGGYNVDPATGDFDTSNPDAQYDIQNPMQPRLVFGYLVAALKMRRERGLPALTIQSCDNIQHNGDLTRKMVVGYAHLLDADLAHWIDKNTSFPNAMVDRITPVTAKSDIEFLQKQYGVHDQWPVTCEPFSQWVIEDQFSDDRPNWQDVGAQFVPDVSPYETMKLRLLNAGHSVLGIPGAIYGLDTIDACMSDERFASFLRGFFDIEAVPVLGDVEGIDLDQYKNTLMERFGNPNISDQLSRICSQSSSKLPVFLIPTIRENLSRDGSIRYGTLVIAAWCYYCEMHADQQGQPLEVIDEMKAALHQAAKGTSDDPLAFIKFKPVFGDLADNDRFATTFTELVKKVYESPDITQLMQEMNS